MHQGLPQNEGVLDMFKIIFYIVIVSQELLIQAVPHLKLP